MTQVTPSVAPATPTPALDGTIRDGAWAPVPLDTAIELRVHGVGGTPPAEMLDDPAPQQVSGDAIAGVWRGHRPSAGFGAVEAYSWGGLTERSLSAALWLVVLPFAMVNVAGWMPPRSTGPHRGLVRLVGLALTAIYVEFAAVIGMDFVAYQCAAAPTCAASGWWVIGTDGVAHGAAQRAVIGAVAPIVVVLGLAVLTHRSRRRYERWELRSGTAKQGTADTPAQLGLTHEGFWRGQGFAAHLAELHLFVGLALTALLLSTTAAGTTTSTWASMLSDVILAGIALAAVAATVTRVRDRIPHGSAPVSGVVLLLAAGVAAWTGRPSGEPPRPMPGILPTFGALLVVFYGGAVLMLVIGLLGQLRRRGPGWATRFRQAYTPFAITVVGGLLGSAVLAGAALWVARTLGYTSGVGDPRGAQAAILYPQPFEAIARSLILIAVLALVVGVGAAAVAGRKVGTGPWQRLGAALADADRGADGIDARTDTRWQRTVGLRLRAPAAILSGAEWALWSLAAGGAAAMAGYGGFWLAHGSGPTAAADRYRDLQALPLPSLSLSISLLTLLPLGAIYVMRQSLRTASVRRLVGIAWDVATFWPRSFHPLCPPCYAERAVPEIQTRLLRIWSAGGSVDLLGHSQGAVLVSAAIASLPHADLPDPRARRLALVTYGNPLLRLYARHFPQYVHAWFIDTVLGRLDGAWTNYFRDTDPIGHRVRPDGRNGPDVYLPDPATGHYFAGDPEPAVRGHCERDYRRQSPFVEGLAATGSRLGKPG